MVEAGDGNIKVVVRCRPLNSRELAKGAKPLIRMEGNSTFLDPPEAGSAQAHAAGGRATEKKTLSFSFDKSYWSAGDRNESRYCSQQTLYDDLGKELLDHGFAGFNACIVAYGQTGSGKSYSMMGYGPDKGIIPLTCSELFDRVAQKTAADPNISFTVEVSYIEIYNEKVRDLLNPKNTGNLRVREHPSLGPYVEDLSKLVVSSYDEMMTLMDEGNKARTVAATNMNETSSRSHAVFTLLLTMKRHDVDTNLDTEKVSRINLVDLAGSERANSTGATGQRLKEGANINKSLTTLGKVIASLAIASQADTKGKGAKKGKGDEFVPYRDSVLTWLLKDSLGGNSKTAMIAAISPADYDETLSTLRYADQAKKIKNKAVVNEDPNAKLVRELKEELEMLRARVSGSVSEEIYDPKIPPEKQKVTYQTKDGQLKTVTKAELQEQLEQSEKIMQSLNETWEEKLIRTQEVHVEREKALEELGISVDKNLVGVHTPKKMPHLVNLNEDPLMSECLIYQLKPGKTMVGRVDSSKLLAIRLTGNNISEEHCYFDNVDGKVTLNALPDSTTFLNGKQIAVGQPYKLRSGFRIILGEHHVFRFNNPEEVRKLRDRATARSNLHLSVTAGDLENGVGSPMTRPESPTSENELADVDWNFAKREAALARLGLDPTLDNLPDDDLNKLFEKIAKVKTMRDHNARRPESSLSQADDIWSESGRPFSSDAMTDDTSVDAGRSRDSPELDDALNDAQIAALDDQVRSIADTDSSEAEDLKAEKELMETQLRLVQTQMKRLLDARARGVAEAEISEIEPVVLSGRHLRLIRKVLDKWRAHRAFSMAEVVLSNAVTLKEANVISKELKKDVTYNFTIASGGSLASPVSVVESIAGLDEFGDVADPLLASATQPSVAVKVLDKRHNAIYLWSLDRLQQRLQRMRNLTAFIDRPAYSQHFSSEEPFYDSPPPAYSFIGNALISLGPLSRKLSSSCTAPILCRYTSEAIGSCRIDIRVSNVVFPSKYSQSNGTASPGRTPATLPQTLPSGSKLSFVLTVDTIKGLSSHDFSAIHLQVRLSSFVGPTVSSEEVFSSPALDMEASTLSDLKYRRTFTVLVNSKVLRYMREGYAPIEFFAKVMPTYLERLERWDELREQKAIPNSAATSNGGPSSPAPSLPDTRPPPKPQMRRSENDFHVSQSHDVVAWFSVTELSPLGIYAPVPVISQSDLDPGCFELRQGLQRRVKLRLVSDSGKQLPWKEISRIRIGNIRLLDAKGRIHESLSKELVDLTLSKPSQQSQDGEASVGFNPDGTGYVAGDALWDSSVHNSNLLNRVTAAANRILVQVHWNVMVDTCAEPVQFSMDVALAIHNRGSSSGSSTPSKLFSFLSPFGSSKILQKSTTLFSVKLQPPLTRSAKDLWRLDTSEKYVRGEESLGGWWKARGVSVVNDYERLVRTERRAADVCGVRAILGLVDGNSNGVLKKKEKVKQMDEDVWGGGDGEQKEGAVEGEALLRKCVDLWKKQTGHRPEILIDQEDSDSETISRHSKKDVRSRLLGAMDDLDDMKLVASTKLVPRSNIPTKKGYLLILTDANENTWEKRWFVLKRPYLHMFSSQDEREELMVIGLDGVSIETYPEMEELLGKRFTFNLFTSSNSHCLSAPNAKEMQIWISKLDPTRVLA